MRATSSTRIDSVCGERAHNPGALLSDKCPTVIVQGRLKPYSCRSPTGVKSWHDQN
jgi:hypothetical protein